MLFNSLEFVVFLASCFALVVGLPHRAQNRALLFASYLFYGLWDWRFLGLILLSTCVDYAVGLALGREEDPRRRKALVRASLAVNLGILGAFKYSGFFAESFAALAASLGFRVSEIALEVVLPVGISFYTFQTLGYAIDVYRRRIEPTSGFLDFALFVAFFPQLVAGPIERAERLLPQITAKRSVSFARVESAAWLILWGAFKKAVIADNLGPLVDAVFAEGASPSGPEVWIATYAFAVQIYCDFSGYTDIARGSARLFGFELMLNFRWPYFARNPAEFWRRWHISLSNWLRDYLYISLGGNRGGQARTLRNLGLTMLLGGLWHGAAWTYVLWGAFHGGWLILHRLSAPLLAAAAPRSRPASWLWQTLCLVVTFHLVCLGWLIFRAESFASLTALCAALWNGGETELAVSWIPTLLLLCAPLGAMQLWQAAHDDPEPLLRLPVLLRGAVIAIVFVSLVLFGEDFGAPFLYFQF